MEDTTAVELRRVAHSQVLVGDGAVAVRIQPGGGTSLEATPGIINALTLRALPPLRGRARAAELAGRDAVLAAALDDLVAGRQIQLVGAAGAGRRAVALALVDLAAARSLPGAVLLGGPEPYSLDSLYSRLAGLFFDVRWHEPDEQALRAVTERLAPSGLITVTDFDLSGDEAQRLLQTFPQCRFVVTSSVPTLQDRAAVHAVTPLTEDDAVALVRGVLGRELTEPERAQALAAHARALGRAAALVTSAAFLRRAAEDPRRTGLVALPPEQQTALLVAGLEDRVRQVLAALAAFGPAPGWLFPLLGPGGQATDPAALVAALEYPGLITLVEDGYAAETGSVGIPDVAGVAERLCAAYDQAVAPNAPSPVPPPRFALEVVRALIAAQAWDPACRLARAAAVAAMSAGRVGPWSELVSFGAQAARAAGRREDLRYFLHEQHTDALLRNDAAAAAAVLLALAALLRPAAPLSSVPRLGRSRAGRALRTGRRAAMAGHGTGAATMVVVVAAAAGALVGAGQHPKTAAGAGHGTSVAVGAAWTAASPTTAPSWTVTLSSTPTSPLPAAAGAMTAQFPVIRAGVANASERAALNKALEQPILTGADLIAEQKQQETAAGLSTAETFQLAEKTTVTQTGDLLSVLYSYGQDAGGPGQPGAVSLLIRKDTGSVVPQQAILSAAVATPAGASKLQSAVLAYVPSALGINGGAYPLASGCEQSYGNSLVGPAMDVGSGTVTFYVSTVQGGCAGAMPAVVPFDKLTGLINPLIVQLAQVPAGVGVR